MNIKDYLNQEMDLKVRDFILLIIIMIIALCIRLPYF